MISVLKIQALSVLLYMHPFSVTAFRVCDEIGEDVSDHIAQFEMGLALKGLTQAKLVGVTQAPLQALRWWIRPAGVVVIREIVSRSLESVRTCGIEPVSGENACG